MGTGSGPTCLVVSAGDVDCLETSSVPVSGIANATSVSASSDGHACAVISGGTIKCWGTNADGQLGDGKTSQPSATPVAVEGITHAIAVRTGSFDTCALISGGSVECWGGNQDGDLGDASIEGSSSPVPVSGITGAIAIEASAFDVCALLSGGSVECWGNNDDGQLGDGTSTGPDGPETCQDEACSTTPVSVSGITTATALTVGGEPTNSPLFSATTHVCVLLSGGSVDCWGANELGQLGDGTFIGPEECRQACSPTPVPVSGITTARAVSAGEDHTCALLSSGSIECWGSNFFGQLGDGKTTGPETCPPFSEEEEISCRTSPEPVVGVS
jgi:hypothetical protein